MEQELEEALKEVKVLKDKLNALEEKFNSTEQEKEERLAILEDKVEELLGQET